jgi:hypothetical protein
MRMCVAQVISALALVACVYVDIAAQTKVTTTDRLLVGSTDIAQVPATDVLRIIGSGTVSGGAGTMRPTVLDGDGDVIRDTNTTVSTAGAWTWGAAGQFSSTLGVTGATTLSSTLGVAGATTLSSSLSVTGNISGSTGTLLATSPLQITTSAPFLRLIESGAGTDETVTEILADADTISLDLVSDAIGTRNSLFKSTRTGLVPGDWRWGAALGMIRPENNGGSSLGSLSKKYLTLHAWELWVQTLVAKETIATIGGHIIVAPTTELTQDLAAASTCIRVKHNQIRSGDTLLLQANGSFEKILVGANALDCSVTGNCSPLGSDYAYCSLTRNHDGTGANDWLAGAAVVNEQGPGDGMIDIYADRSASSEGYPGQVITDFPVAYWRMSESPSGQTVDVMGNVGNAVEAGTPDLGLGTLSGVLGTTTSDPIFGNRGATGYLTVADDADLRITGDLTIEWWMYRQSTTPATSDIISRGGSKEYAIVVDVNGAMQFCHGNTSTFTCVTTSNGFVSAGGADYTHYAIVRDATSSPKRILFYKDGVLASTHTYTQTVTTSTNTLRIGDNPDIGGRFLDGDIDEVAIYNYQVSADRILLHFNARKNNSISKFTVGPTLCGNVRTGSAAFDMAERWCLGNLAGTYDYSSTAARYGLAAGSVSGAWFGIDATSGLRGMYGSIQKFGINMSGVATFVEGAFTIDNLGPRLHNTASSTGEAASYSFTGALAYTKRPLLGYLESGGAGTIVLSGGDRASGNAHVLIEAPVGNITIGSTDFDTNISAGDDINLSVVGDFTINGSAGVTKTCTVLPTVVKGVVTAC